VISPKPLANRVPIEIAEFNKPKYDYYGGLKYTYPRHGEAAFSLGVIQLKQGVSDIYAATLGITSGNEKEETQHARQTVAWSIQISDGHIRKATVEIHEFDRYWGPKGPRGNDAIILPNTNLVRLVRSSYLPVIDPFPPKAAVYDFFKQSYMKEN
jgi:hypothetical protein